MNIQNEIPEGFVLKEMSEIVSDHFSSSRITSLEKIAHSCIAKKSRRTKLVRQSKLILLAARRYGKYTLLFAHFPHDVELRWIELNVMSKVLADVMPKSVCSEMNELKEIAIATAEVRRAYAVKSLTPFGRSLVVL